MAKATSVTVDESTDTLKLGITIADGIPTFKFSGLWTVRDILLVRRLLGRKYREYMKHMRKALLPK